MGTQNRIEWYVTIDEDRLLISMYIGGKRYEWTLQDFIRESPRLLKKNSLRVEMLAGAADALWRGLQRRARRAAGWASIADCTFCGEWPDSLSDDNSTNSSQTDARFPERVELLVKVRGDRTYDRPEIRRCPECGTYYRIENREYEWTPTGTDDVDTLTRLTPADALPLLPDAERAELTARWSTTMDALEKALTSPRAVIAAYAKRALASRSASTPGSTPL